MEAAIAGIHFTLAKSLHIPELELSESEAHLLAESTANVAKHYPVLGAAISGKSMDHIAFAGAIVAVYGSRIATLSKRKKETKKSQAQAPQETAQTSANTMTGLNTNFAL